MAIGPVEYLILGFPGNNFTGRIAPALADLVDRGLVNIIDLTFVGKDDDGNLVTFEFDALEELAEFAGIDGEIGGLINDEDIAYAAAALEPGSSAAILVWENAWATTFAEAVRDADGVVLEGGRIPNELIEAALAELAAAI